MTDPAFRPADGPGRPEPLGVTVVADGVNVAVYSAHAEAIEFCLFAAGPDGADVETRVRLPEHSGDVFHGFIGGVAPGARYGLRAHGPFEPQRGHRFNPAKLLVDPYATRLDRPFALHTRQFGHHVGDPDADLGADAVDSAAVVPKAIVEAPAELAPVARPDIPWDRTIVYEASVKGLSALNPAVPEAIRGTFAGLGTPASIQYLTDLGITTLEILPAMTWVDERHLPALGLSNAWGYNPVAFLAPDPRLAPGGWAEVRAAVDALHGAGIEVILDVVLNHSGESDELGPTLSLRGLDNASYYRLRPDAPRYNINDTGCGNTLALDRPAMLRLGLDALRQWAIHGGLDGFRFDLAATLGRTETGFDPHAGFLSAIAQDPVLRGLKLIAEPWDIGPGGYQPGRFPAAWGEWNDRYRDDVRRFWRGDGHMVGALATRLAGSEDLFGSKRRPSRSINFVTAHDGFTLADLVSHAHKRNRANGEDNRDGTDANLSWNNGVEGPSDDPAVRDARLRDQKALIVTLAVSRGTPMLAMGAEAGRSQDGNNNSYAQDNALNWLDHAAIDTGLLAFTRRALALRAAHPALYADRFLTGAAGADGIADVEWCRADGEPMDGGAWNDPGTGTLTMVLAAPDEQDEIDRVAVVVHRDRQAVRVAPPWNRMGFRWQVALDSAAETTGEPTAAEGPFDVAARSVVVLEEIRVDARARQAPPGADLTDRLAQAAGIAPDWWDEMGGHHRVPEDSKRALLGAMGLDTSTRGAAADALERLAADGVLRPVPRTTVAWDDRPARLVVPEATARGGAVDLVLTLEDGSIRAVRTGADPGSAGAFQAPDGRRGRSLALDLGALPLGVHQVRLADRPETCGAVVVAPRRAFRPQDLETRRFGIGAHLYALARPGDQGIGDFTTLARLGTSAARAGAVTVGLNPLHALFAGERERASPYHPSDRRCLDPIYIDLAALGDADPAGAARRVLAERQATADALSAARSIDYPAVWALKQAALRAAFDGFEALRATRPDAAPLRAFADFVTAGGPPLARFARFEALAARHAGPWPTWPAETVRADDPGPVEDARFALYLQWVADRQLAAAAEASRAAGLSLGFYRDLAVGAAPDGAETWPGDADASGANGFALGASIGAPPDLFSAEGQVWNLPPPIPLVQEAIAGADFAALLAANMRHAGILRIDHVMGLRRLFWVPAGAAGRDGAYVTAPFELLLARLTLESVRARVAVVGEDLGTVPDGFRERLALADILSYRVLWFERDGTGFRPPARWPDRAAACVSTHDLPTLEGWWQGADIAERQALGFLDAAGVAEAEAARRAEKTLLVQTIGATAARPEVDGPGIDSLNADRPDAGNADPVQPLTDAEAAAVHAHVSAAPSCLMLAQADDLAGEVAAVNLPGTDRERPNWRRRLRVGVDDLCETPRARAILAALTDRGAHPSEPG
ncbi:glycogen debranching protein GlgX [Methyloraptor flagellatus]|uniref:4-alpha-glucanotransferase n=1 Tax=Methyloraptor flagellatus TaxID=3162530 RepID=A0AAU7XAA4_9HYPH